MKRSIPVLSLLLALTLTGCYNDSREDLYPIASCDTSDITYTGFIAPLMRQSCATSTCHDNATASLNIVLDNYAGVLEIALNGKMTGALTHAAGFYPMPKNAPRLDDCTLLRVQKWIDAGAPEN